MSRVEGLASPESLDHAATFGMTSVRTERVEAIGALERIKDDVLEYLTSERLAVLAVVDAQTGRRSPTSTAAERDAGTGRGTAKEGVRVRGEMRGRTVADIDVLADRIIRNVAFTLAALLVLAALLAIVVRKAVPPRGQWCTLPPRHPGSVDDELASYEKSHEENGSTNRTTMDCSDWLVRGVCHPARGPTCRVVSWRVASAGRRVQPSDRVDRHGWGGGGCRAGSRRRRPLRWVGGAWVRKMAWLGVVPLTAALNVAYLSAIPALFLIEADSAAEQSWTEHCFVRGAELRLIRTPATQASPGPRAWWAALPPDGRDTLLRVPDCSLTDAVIPEAGPSPEGYLDFFTRFEFASPEGAAIIEQTGPAHVGADLADAGGIHVPRFSRWQPQVIAIESPPVLSRRGDAVPHGETVVGSGPRGFTACTCAKRRRSQRRPRSRSIWPPWGRPRMC